MLSPSFMAFLPEPVIRAASVSDSWQAAAAEMFVESGGHERLTVQDADVVSAALEAYRRHARVDFFDHLLLEAARKAGHLPVGTFDRQFAKVAAVETI